MPSGPVRKPEIERPGWNGSVGRLGAMEQLEAIAERIGEHDQVLHAPFVGERARAARDLDAGGIEPRRKRVERGRVRDFPAEEADALAAVGIDDDALLAVVHAERQRATRLLSMRCRPSSCGAVVAPVVELLARMPRYPSALAAMACLSRP